MPFAMVGRDRNSVAAWGSRKLVAIRAYTMVYAWKIHNWVTRLRFKYPVVIEMTLWATALVAMFFVTDKFRNQIVEFIPTHEVYQAFQSLLVGVGSALIGATAIVASLLLFSLQVNVERLPHGMFRRLNSDRALLLSFVASIATSILIAVTSLVSVRQFAPTGFIILVFGTALILRMMLFSYRRMLTLVSPVQQMLILVTSVANEFVKWDRRARWFAPLQKLPDHDDGQPPPTNSIDFKRAAFFQYNQGWDAPARNLLKDIEAFAAWASSKMDSQAHAAALSAIIQINRAYIATKRRTFVANNPFIENELSREGLFTDTLECLTRITQASVQRRDEPGLRRIMRAYVSLFQMYVRLPYADPISDLSHAQTASFYLMQDVERMAAHGLTDSTMNGVREISACASDLIGLQRAQDAYPLIDKIAYFGAFATTIPSMLPVTRIAMEEFAELTARLINSANHDVSFAARHLREGAKGIALLILELPEVPLTRTHSFPLAPYFGLEGRSLRERLADLANAVAGADGENAQAATVCRNLAVWADRMALEVKDILLKTITRNSMFHVDLLYWIEGMTETCFVAARSPACPDHARGRLDGAAYSLISTLSWIPRDANTLKFADLRLVADTLFDTARKARQADALDVFDQCERLLFRWGFETGRHLESQNTLTRCLFGLAVFALARNDENFETALIAQINAELAKADTVHADIRGATALFLREAADNLDQAAQGFDRIKSALTSFDSGRTQSLLGAIAIALGGAQGEVT